MLLFFILKYIIGFISYLVIIRQDERQRIEAKVGVLLHRKDAAIADLEGQLAHLRESSQELEERLEELRNDTFK